MPYGRHTIMNKCICGSIAVHNRTIVKGCKVDTKGIEQAVDITTVECKKCGVVRQIDLPFNSEKGFTDFYKKEYPPVKQAYEIKDYKHDRKVAALRCDAYNIPERVKTLDVGSGSGAFVDECRSRGIEAYGCEIGQYHYKNGDEFIYKQQFEDINFPTDHFEVVTCHDVLEHVLNPVKMVEELFRVTTQEGECIIDFPRFYHKAGKHHWKGVEHIWYFTTEQLEKLIMKVGFAVQKVTHPIESKTVFYLTKPIQKRVKILLPPGIGDTYWPIVKIKAFLKREKLGVPDICILANEDKKYKTHKRSFPFIEMFPFLNSSNIVAENTTAKKIWQEAYVMRGKTIFKNILGYDYFISYNGVLESGTSMAEVDIDLKCDWFPDRFISLEEDKFKEVSIQKYGKYIIFFFVFRGSFLHWVREFSVDNIITSIKGIVQKTGCTPVFVGADWDKEDTELTRVKNSIPNIVDLTGKTTVAQLFGLIRGSEMVVGYPCGLTMLAAGLKQKVLLIWNDWNRYGFMWNSVPPSVKNKTCFIENTKNLTIDILMQKVEDIYKGTCSAKEYENRMYEYTKEKALNRFKTYNISSNSKVLDINSGGGAFVDICRENKIEAYGCELLPYDFSKNDDYIYHQELEDINFPTDYFDVITCSETFGYKTSPVLFLKEAFRALKQEGKFILHFFKRTSTNVWFYSSAQLGEELKKVGFQVQITTQTKREVIFNLTKPIQKRVKILFPPGIGDCYWEIVKINAFLKQKNLGLPDIHIANRRNRHMNAYNRSVPFIRMFPFLHIKEEILSMRSTQKNELIWREAYHSKGRTIFENILGCDYFVSHNGYLTAGMPLEETDPDLKCEWFPPMFVSLEQEKYKKYCQKQFGKYIVFYYTFIGSNKVLLQKISIKEIKKITNSIVQKTGCTPIFVGGTWNREDKGLMNLISCVPNAINLVGETNLDQLFGLIRGAEMVYGIPSGLTIMSIALKQKTVVLWSDFFHPRFSVNICPPSTLRNTYFPVYTSEYSGTAPLIQLGVDLVKGKKIKVEEVKAKEVPLKLKEQPQPVQPIPNKDSKLVTILCVLKSGGDYTIEYVKRLKNMVDRNTTIPHQFLCLTDLEISSEICDSRKFKANYPGWWGKVELFRSGLINTERAVYFDLDTIILGNIDDLLRVKEDFAALQPWNLNNRLLGICASGLLAWNNGKDYSFIYKKFNIAHTSEYPKGDQQYISQALAKHGERYIPLQNLVSGIYSYKRNCRAQLPQDARIICFHGRPRLTEVIHLSWVKTNWI